MLGAAIVGRGRGSEAPISRTIAIIYCFSPRGLDEHRDLYLTWEEGVDVLNDHGEALRAAEPAEEEG